ncbi:PP0621 family protein [Solimonas marina]|uniref:Uncharacterized protein n=1 Tax=Solimonas marina TaxID=2714601 RepID=A0A969WAM6_9GAMM|nr:PP0621 family protein [Solimonas marina]NKF21390.1 hypothetical protein [Solimonas marina]
MSLFRLLLLGAAVWLVWRWLFPQPRRPRTAATSRPAPPPDYERMLRCAQCGTHMPATSLSPDGRCDRCVR